MTRQMNARLSLSLLEALDRVQIKVKLVKCKEVLFGLSEIHNVRLMWFKAIVP